MAASAQQVTTLAGGFATPAKPGLFEPGTTDPRTRSFTAAILDPALVAQYGEEQVKQLSYAGLVPPPEDLDRVALFAPPPINWPGGTFSWLDTTSDGPLPDGSYRDPTWQDVEKAGTKIGRPDLDALATRSSLAWWRHAYALGPLPDDTETVDLPGSSSYNWPEGDPSRWFQTVPNLRRDIYFWGFGKDGRLYKHLQVQKQDSNGVWHIFNQWGQDLTFVWQPETHQWIAGFDFGDWATQHKQDIISGLQIGMQIAMSVIPVVSAVNVAAGAIGATFFGVSQLGLSVSTQATLSALTLALSAQRAFIEAMTALAGGDFGQALSKFGLMAGNLSKMTIDTSQVSQAFDKIAKSDAFKAYAKLVGAEQTTDVGILVNKGKEYVAKVQALKAKGDQILQGGTDAYKQARELLPEQLRGDFDRWVSEGTAQAKSMAMKVFNDEAGKLTELSAAKLYEARATVPPHLRPWFDRAIRRGPAALSDLNTIPWYARAVYDLGASIGSVAPPASRAEMPLAKLGPEISEAARAKRVVTQKPQSLAPLDPRSLAPGVKFGSISIGARAEQSLLDYVTWLKKRYKM